jgi:hypothetical protein
MAEDVKLTIGVDVAGVAPGMLGASRSVQQGAAAIGNSFQGWVGNSNSVGAATAKLEQQLKGFASEQRQQGRMARFYAGEIAAIIPAAEGAQSAIQGLAGIAVEGLAGGVSFGLAFEVAKFAIGGVVEVLESAKKRTKELEEVSNQAAAGIASAFEALDKYRTKDKTPSEKAYKEVFDAGTKGAKELTEAIEKLRPTTYQLVKAFMWDGAAGMKRLNEEFDRAARNLDRMGAAARVAATEASNLAAPQPMLGPGTDTAAVRFEFDTEAVAKEKVYVDLLNQEVGALLARNKALREGLTLLPREVPEMPGIKEIAGGFPLAGPGNDQGALGFRLDSAKVDEQAKASERLAAAGDSIAASFGAAGAAIGGMAGNIIAQIANIVVLTLKFIGLAIAASAASAAQTPIVGPWAAIAGGVAVAAALFSMIVGLADGGPMQGGRPYLVGERGPELVVPSSSGTVIPNHMLGGGGNVSVVFNAPVDQAWWRSNERHIVRTLREATAGRRA